jgi:hypothetical protein
LSKVFGSFIRPFPETNAAAQVVQSYGQRWLRSEDDK